MAKRNKGEPKGDSPTPLTTNSRSRTLERRKEKQQQQRRQTQFTIAAVLVAVVLLGGLFAIISNQPAEAPIPDGVVARYEGIPTSLTEEGFPVLGNPEAPVEVFEYSSFACPACKTFHDNAYISLLDRVRAGEITFTFVPLTIGSVANGEGAARAAVCAAEQDMFWAYHDVLFDWHGRFANQAFSQNRLSAGIEALGMNTAAYNTCLSNRAGDIVQTARDYANARGISATPTITVDGVQVASPDLSAVNAQIDQRLGR